MKKQISAATTTNNTASMTYDGDGEEDVEREEHRRNVEEAEWLLEQFFQMPPAPAAVVVEHDNSSTSRLEEEEEIYMETCSTPPKEETFAEKPKTKGVFTRRQQKQQQWRPTSASTCAGGIPKSISFQSTQPPPQPSKKTSASPRYTLPPPPHTWPQRPVFVRANPRTGTQIVGIRYNQDDKGSHDLVSNHEAYWEAHAGVPVNDGYEAPEQTIVVDFVSKFFVGSLLVRIRGTPSHIEESSEESNSQDTHSNNGQSSSDDQQQQQQPYYYFANRQRTFQSVLRGQFRRPLAITDCLTGQEFRRPPGSLPAHWIVAAFEAVLKRIAPHNVLDIEGRRPRSLAPLVTTAQTIQVRKLKESQQEKEDDHPQGLLLYDGSFFYDSDYDYYNPCYDSNPVEHMAQEWPEPHASHEKSIVCDANRSPDGINSPRVVEDSQKNRKFRKAYFNKKFDVWKKQREDKEQEEERRERKDTPTNQQEGNNASNGNSHDNDHDHDNALYQFTTDKEYTFEFYEHLLNFDNPKREVELDMKLPFLHHIPIAPITDGQPIVIMAAIKKDQLRSSNKTEEEEEEYTTNDDEESSDDGDLEYLWNFEIWHESLYHYACRAMQKKSMQE